MAIMYFASFLGLLTASLLTGQSLADCLCDEFGPRCPDSVCNRVPNLITTASGALVDDITTVLTPGEHGPLLLEDTVVIEHFQHLHREKVPERVVHANGGGAYGYFTVTNDISKYCKASLFGSVGQKTEVFVRFSTCVQEAGSCDTVRDPKGAAIKFYTNDGNLDIACNNSPVFGIKDPLLFPDFIKAAKRDSVTSLRNDTAFWDFLTLHPESSYLVIWLFSNKSIPDGYRHMPFYSINTFTLVSRTGKHFYAKFHFKPDLGEKYMNASYAITTCASDFDYNKRDLYNSILAEEFPSWTMYIQTMTIEQANKYKGSVFDVTKKWNEEHNPLIKVGGLELNRNVKNYFAEVEQAAFSPSALVPGIEPSPDIMLQARMFAYPDAQRYRIGVNYQQLPINCPIVAVKGQQRNGFMAINNENGQPNYYPNSYHQNVCPEAAWAKWHACGYVGRYEKNADSDDYIQTKHFWESLDETEKKEIVQNLCNSISGAASFVQTRAVEMFGKFDKNMGADLKACIDSTTSNVY